MATAVIMPKLGLTMTEGTIVRWLKAEGDPVEKGEPLLEILTDKANMEVEAQEAGRLHIMKPEGAVVPILEVIGELLAPGEAPGSPAAAGAPAAAVGPSPQTSPVPTPAGSNPPGSGREGGRLRISPAARRVARELGVDLAALSQSDGTGPGGRLVQEDVRRVAARLKRESPAAAQLAQPLTAVEPGPGRRSGSQAGEVQVIPLTGIRGIVAERMSRSAREAPQFHVSADLVFDRLVALRERLQPQMEAAYRVRLSYTDLLVKAVARVLVEFPLLNAYVDDRQITVQPQVNLGVAVGSERGLVVPVLKDAARRPLAEVAAELKRLVAAVRGGTLGPDDLAGGTFTLSNLGMYGVTSFTALLNPPQTGILAVGALRDELRPAGRGIQVQNVATVTLTCDHRAVDGLLAARFLARLRASVEGPELEEVCAL